MTVTLEPGVYDITCSAKSKFIADLRGKLTVTGDASAAKARPAELIGALAEYRFTVYEEAGELVDKTTALAEAVKAGDVAAARALYAPARMHYERIEPVAELFADLDGAIDSRADDHEKREADPGFTGFHRLEYALWVENSLQGMGAVADKLVADVTELQGRLRALDIPPGRMAGGAALLMEEVAATKISGEEERYSRTDLWDIAANVDGAERIVALLRPLLVKADAPLVERIEGKLVAVRAVLAGYALPESGYRSYDTLTEADRNALRASVTALAEDLSRLRGTLGLD
jgi:iron uptake system component EfeO